MKIEIIKRNIGVYELAIIIMTIKVMLDKIVYYNNHIWLDDCLTYSALFLFLIVIILERQHSLKEWVFMGVIGILCLYSSLQMREYYLLMSYFVIIASIKKDVDNSIRIMNMVKVFFVAFSVLWYLLAYFILQDTVYIIYKNGRIAHHFGFSHPNAFALIVCWIVLERLYLNYHKITTLKLLGLFASGIVLYYFTSCDTSMYIMIFAAILIGIQKTAKNSNWMYVAAKFIFPVLAILNIISIYIYATREGMFYKFVYSMDSLMTGRIRQAAKIFDLYGATLFGHYVDINGRVSWDRYYRLDTLVCDGLYSRLFVCGGIIFTIIITILIWKYFKYDDIKNRVFIILFSIYALLENHGLNVYMVFPLLVWGNSFFKHLHMKHNKFKIKI